MATTAVAKLNAMFNAESVQKQFHNALKGHKDVFIASIIDLYSGSQELQQCNPGEVVQEALKAAVLNLPFNKALGFAHLLVFQNNKRDASGQIIKVPTPTFVVGYRGYIQLAMRTGAYLTINADVVYKGEIKSRDKLTGHIDLSGEKESDEIIGYFAHFELLNGFKKTHYMTVKEVAVYAKTYAPTLKFNKGITVDLLVAKANAPAVSGSQGWTGDFKSMALKTVIRQLLGKYGFLSLEMMTAIDGDTKIEGASEEERERIVQNTAATNIDLDAEAYEEIQEPAAIAAQSATTFEVPQAPQAAPQPVPRATAAPQPDSMFEDEPNY